MHDLIAVAEEVADERAFIRLLELMALDWKDERKKELAKPSRSILCGSERLGKWLDRTILRIGAAWVAATSPGASVGQMYLMFGVAQQ